MDFEKSSIERLKRTLYSRNEDVVPKEKRTPVSAHPVETATNWGTKTSFELEPEMARSKNNSFFNKFLIGSLVFLGVSLAISLFIFFGGINMISSNNLDIKIVAPSSISSGEELSVALSIVNANSSDIEDVNLFIEYPDGSEKVTNGETLTREKIDLDIIEKGNTKEYTARTVLFGEKDSLKVFTFRLEYRVKGSNAVFSKERTFEVIIGSSPILLKATYPTVVNSGQELTINIDVTSNSAVPMRNVLVKVEYPYGFTYKDSNIKPVRDNSIWDIGDLKDGDKKTITIKGSILGQNLEDRSFRISAGAQSDSAQKDFDNTLVAELITIGIRKSFFDLVVNTSSDTISLGGKTSVSINWTNTLTDKVTDVNIEAKISGNVFDRNKVTVGENGFFRSTDNTIVWDKNNFDKLSSIFPGDSGRVSFSVASIDNPTQIGSVKNPVINLHVTMRGQRSGSDIETVTSEEDIVIKIASQVEVSGKSFRSVGPFSNTGPIPPRADKDSTYTISLNMTNTTNNLKDAVVFTTLPTGVVWKGEISPSTEKITYNPDTRIVSWEVGSVSAGAGYAYAPKSASFKVGITPSVNQIGTVPSLTGPLYSEFFDTHTGNLIKLTAGAVTTKFADSNFVYGNDVVNK